MYIYLWAGVQVHDEVFILVLQCLQRMEIYANFLSGMAEGFTTLVYQIYFPERNGKLTLFTNEDNVQMKVSCFWYFNLIFVVTNMGSFLCPLRAMLFHC